MLYYIEITDSTYSQEEMADLLKEVARQIESGNTSGYHPTWQLIQESEEIKED